MKIENENLNEAEKPQLNIAVVMHSADLIQKQIKLIEQKKIYVQVQYERGRWMYIIHKLPSDKDIEFANSVDCQDGDLWLDSDLMTPEWYLQEHKSFLEALEKGINEALSEHCA